MRVGLGGRGLRVLRQRRLGMLRRRRAALRALGRRTGRGRCVARACLCGKAAAGACAAAPGTQDRPAGIRGGGATRRALVGGGVLRHACRIHPSGTARPARSSSRSKPDTSSRRKADTRIRCPGNGIPAWSEAVPVPPTVPADPPDDSTVRPTGPLRLLPVWPSYPLITSCRPSVTYGQALCELRSLPL
ncbi:hypothetical protein STRIP9103_06397 [Streptomyces ipomoeae 91-03]|uniref:Uncharacterized protein n=1 Tax=Streptomyces ipomoeae 91-03 TaxID=698759 RepID=L1KXZ6_9ACTN|nr:hypothetical protein STRIP9103_06397 [Streptomyces ipomoeae 91-03]